MKLNNGTATLKRLSARVAVGAAALIGASFMLFGSPASACVTTCGGNLGPAANDGPDNGYDNSDTSGVDHGESVGGVDIGPAANDDLW